MAPEGSRLRIRGNVTIELQRGRRSMAPEGV